MPKENTHLFFARGLKEKLENAELKKIIENNLSYYYLGAISPDIFFYSVKEEERAISESLHGKNGEPTNKIVFEILDGAKDGKNDGKELAFLSGYLTHCALDINFHPVIFPLTGNVFSENKGKKKIATYQHRYWETFLDWKLNDSVYFNEVVRTSLFSDLKFMDSLVSEFKIAPERFLYLVKKHALANRLIRKKWFYYFLFLLNRLGIYDKKEDLGAFYQDIKKGEQLIPEVIVYKDMKTGVNKKTSVGKLLAGSEKEAKEMILGAFRYYKNLIGKKELEILIPGKSLDCGLLNCPIKSLKF